jgi:hypothetical protein
MKPAGQRQEPLYRNIAISALLLVAVVIARFQTFNDPVLGFDEQYYLLVAQRMLHGAVPYVDIWDRKPIGLFLIYAGAILPGADPFLSYKLLAAGFVWATAFAIWRGARRDARPFGAAVAALLYVFWLNFMEGEGGQAPVFYNLPVLLAALLVRRTITNTRRPCEGKRPSELSDREALARGRTVRWTLASTGATGEGGRLFATGLAAMLLEGLAIQVKYTAVFEGAFFGLALVWAGWRVWGFSARWVLAAFAWAAVLLAPTLAALGYYAAIGQSHAFVFANFLSIFGRLPDPLPDRLMGLILILAILSPLAIVAILSALNKQIGFVQLWALAALFGMLVFGAFLSPNYGLPIVAPLCLCAAPWLDRRGFRRGVGIALAALSLGGGIFAVRQVIIGKGNRAEALAVAAAARPTHGGCLWVWDGYPALYMLTGSCIPTRWAFPGQLNTANENTAAASGVDPSAEVRRVLASRPETIVDDYPAYDLGNRATRALVQAELARSYVLAARIATGSNRYRLVFHRKPEAVHPAGKSP